MGLRSDYNSRPRISCAVALPLGWTSEAEVFEVILTEPLPHTQGVPATHNSIAKRLVCAVFDLDVLLDD